MRKLFKLILLAAVPMSMTMLSCANPAFAQSSEEIAYNNAANVYCLEMAAMKCEKAKAPYYQYLNQYFGLPIESQSAFLTYCQKMAYGKICMNYCSHDDHCDYFGGNQEALILCTNKCSQKLGGLYKNTPEYKRQVEENRKQAERNAIALAERKAADEEARRQQDERDRIALAAEKAELERQRIAAEEEFKRKQALEAERQKIEAEDRAKKEEAARQRAEIERQAQADEKEAEMKRIIEKLTYELGVLRDSRSSFTQDQCACACLKYRDHKGGMKPANVSRLVELYYNKVYIEKPGTLESCVDNGFGYDPAYLSKTLNNYRSSNQPHLEACDGICKKVVNNAQNSRRSLQDLINDGGNTNQRTNNNPNRVPSQGQVPVRTQSPRIFHR